MARNKRAVKGGGSYDGKLSFLSEMELDRSKRRLMEPREFRRTASKRDRQLDGAEAVIKQVNLDRDGLTSRGWKLEGSANRERSKAPGQGIWRWRMSSSNRGPKGKGSVVFLDEGRANAENLKGRVI